MGVNMSITSMNWKETIKDSRILFYPDDLVRVYGMPSKVISITLTSSDVRYFFEALDGGSNFTMWQREVNLAVEALES